MGAIEKFVKNAVGRGIDTVQNFGDKLSSIVGRVQGYVGSAFEVAKNGETYVGIDINQVGNIRDAIRAYVSNIQTELAKLNTDASNTNALKGDVAAAARDYVDAVSEVSKAYVSALLKYSELMQKYADSYTENDETLSSSVREEVTALKSSAEYYTEQY